jgi:hypothetical protein
MELEEVDVDLTPEQQKEIVDLFAQLQTLSLYDLLLVPRAADKKAVKRAYNERALKFHPDRFFRKRLGSFKGKLDAIFIRMTEAHDVLCSQEHRARYDAALAANRHSVIDFMLEEVAAEMAGDMMASRFEEIFLEEPIEVQTEPPPPVESLPPAPARPRPMPAVRPPPLPPKKLP